LADLNGNITEANDAFLQMVSYTREELRSGKLRWDEITPPEYRRLHEEAIAELISSGVCTPFEKEFIRKDGSHVPVMVGGTMVEQSQQSALCFVLDITERKQAEQKIHEQAALLNITTDAILVRDLGNKFDFGTQGLNMCMDGKPKKRSAKCR
jgi:PAS domain S-box-containing protein